MQHTAASTVVLIMFYQILQQYLMSQAMQQTVYCRLRRKPSKQMLRLVQLQTVAVDMVNRKYVRSVA